MKFSDRHRVSAPSPSLLNSRAMPAIQRRFPYPYKALLAVSSDADAMSPWEFTRIHRFLNTRLSVYDACYRYENEDAWADELNVTSLRIRTSMLLNFLSNSSILSRLSE